MAAPWEKYQQEEAPAENAPSEAPPPEAAPVEATPAPTAEAAPPTEQSEGPWTKYQTQEAQPASAEDQPSKNKPVVQKTGEEEWAKQHPIAGRLLSAATGVADVMPFRKDIQAGIHAATDFGPGSFTEKFTRSKKAQDRAQRALAGEYPMMHLAGNVAPLIFAPELALTAPETAAATKMAPYVGDIASKVITSGASGAGLGALYGAGEGTTLEERKKNIGTGAGFGLLGGVAAPAVTSGAKKVVESVKDLAPYLGIGTERAAGKKANEAWENLTDYARKSKSGLTAEQIAESEKYGQPVYPIDVMGAPGIAAAKRASAYSPEAKQMIESELRSRNENQQNMFRGFLSEHVMNKPGIDIFSDLGKARIKSAADEYVPESYKVAFKHPENQNVVSEALENSLQYSSVQKAIPKAIKSFNDDRIKQGLPKIESPFEKMRVLDNDYGIRDNAAVPLELWDKIKRQVQSQANKYKPSPLNASGNPELHRQLSGQAADVTKALKELNLPGYNESLEGAAKYKGEQSAWDLGAKFASATDRQKINNISSGIEKLNPDEREHFAHAYLQNMSDKLLGAFKNRNIGSMLKEQQKEKNIAALGPDRAKLIHDYLERADIANKSLSGLGGSDTSRNIYDMLKNTSGPGTVGGGLAGAAYDIYHQLTDEHGGFNYKKLLEHTFEGALAGRIAGTRGKLNEEYGKKLAERLVSTDPMAVREAMTEINKSPALKQAFSKAEIIMQQLAGSEGARANRASGGKVDKRDYPAKRLTRMERALKRAQDSLAEETKPIMSLDDSHVAQALHIAKEK
jgi:hypothetical protein